MKKLVIVIIEDHLFKEQDLSISMSSSTSLVLSANDSSESSSLEKGNIALLKKLDYSVYLFTNRFTQSNFTKKEIKS